MIEKKQKMAKNKYDISEYRKQELSDLAEFIAAEYFDDTLICPYKLVEIYGLTYSFEDYGDSFDGMLEHKYGRFHIYLNSRHVKHRYQARVRFTLAHELGHYLIDEHRRALEMGLAPSHPSFTNFASDNEVELEADFIASSLLLPRKRLERDVLGRKFSFNLIEELSTKYQTSITATLLKFASIGNHPLMIVCSVNGRIKWFRYSDDFPFKYINALSGFKVPKNTSVGEFFYEHGTRYDDSDEVVYAEDWFRLNNDDDYGREFYEHCIYSEKNNFVLSVIWEN